MTACDINCCCDPDCNEDQRALFSVCEEANIYNRGQKQRHCHRKDYLYKNNTPFYMEVHENGLFCIVTNNLKKEEEYPTLRVSREPLQSIIIYVLPMYILYV